MRSEEALERWKALTAPFWVEAGALGFHRFAEACFEHERAKGLFTTLSRGIGGPEGAHLIEIDGAINDGPRGTEGAVTGIRFIAYVNVPNLRKKRTFGMLVTDDAAPVRFDLMVSSRPTAAGPHPAEKRPGAATLADLWNFHQQEISVGGMSVVAPDGDPGRWVEQMDDRYGKALEDDEKARWGDS